MVKAEERQDTFRDKLIPWYFVAAFLLLFVVDGTMATLAVKTGSGIEIEHAYERGLGYNRYIEEAAAQKERGWQGGLLLKGRMIAFTLKDRQGQPLTGATVKADCLREAFSGQDFALNLKEVAPGVYQAEGDFPAAGQWIVKVSAKWQNYPYVLQQTTFVE